MINDVDKQREYADILEKKYIDLRNDGFNPDSSRKMYSTTILEHKLNKKCNISVSTKLLYKYWKKFYPDRFNKKLRDEIKKEDSKKERSLLKDRIAKKLDNKNKFTKKELSLVLEIIKQNPDILLRKY